MNGAKRNHRFICYLFFDAAFAARTEYSNEYYLSIIVEKTMALICFLDGRNIKISNEYYLLIIEEIIEEKLWL